MNNKPKHTPGPWESQGRFIYQGDTDIILAEACGTISNIHIFEQDEQRANARLILAGPEMLEALEHLRAIALLVPDDVWAKATDAYNKPHSLNQNGYICACDLARDAIAKAKGE